MKRNSKKIVSVLLAAVMVVCTAFTFEIDAFADSTDSTAAEYVSVDNENIDRSQDTEDGMGVISDAPADKTAVEGTDPAVVDAIEKASVDGADPAVTDEVYPSALDGAALLTGDGTATGDDTPVDPDTQETPVTPVTKPEPRVGSVKKLTKTSNETKKITLKWDKVSGANGYVIYYCNADKTAKYKMYKKVKTNSVTVTGLTANTPYYFKVAAYIIQDGKTYEGAQTEKRTATQPEIVKKLTLKSSDGKVTFTWSKVPRATGYKIYRSGKNGKYVLYKTIKKGSTTSFTDKKAKKGKAYSYKVQAYRFYSATGQTYHGKKSSVLRIASGLGKTNITQVTTQLWRVSLSWSPVSNADGYDIYYSKTKTGTYQKLASTKKTFYNSKKLKNGMTYYFQVKPYKLSSGSKTKAYGTSEIVKKKVSNKGYGGKSVGNTYIEVSIRQQHMWMYVNGKLYVETDVVTGNDDGAHNTPRGTHKIWQRQSPATLVGADYATPVSYWLAFTYSGCGIHDSNWRGAGEYGGTTYKGNGSHGCVNTPYSKVQKIYSKARIGTYVVVY